MSEKIKIPCGGFYIDDQTLQVKDGELTVIGGGSSLPPVTVDDKGKFLHTNDTTGNLEWAEGDGSGNTKEPVKIVFVNNRTAIAQLMSNNKVDIGYARESKFTVDSGDLAELTIDGEIYTGTLEFVESDVYDAIISKDNKTATIEIQPSSVAVIDDDLFGFIVGESYTFTIKVIPKNQPKETVIITFEPDSYDMSGATGHCEYTPKDIVDLIDNGYNVVFELMGWVSNPIYKFTVTEATCVKADGLLFTSMMPNNLVLCSYQYITNHASATTTLSVGFTLYSLS